MVAWGVQAIVTQSILLREALVLMFGSELAWGIVLFAWLLGVAIGGAAGGLVAPRLRRPDMGLVIVLLLLSAAACVELWVFRGARAWLGVERGELLPLREMALAAMLLVTPAGALVGASFPLACCAKAGNGANEYRSDETTESARDAHSPQLAGAGPLASVYALESVGSLIGGAAFSFWAVEHLTPIHTALLCAVLTLFASTGLMLTTARKPYTAILLAVLASDAMMIAIFAGGDLNRSLVHRRWRDLLVEHYKLRAEAESRYQNLALLQGEDEFTLYCDGQPATGFPRPYDCVGYAHLWMCQHPSPKQILVIGGGAEGLLAEILAHPVERVVYVEPDPRQIDLIEPFLPELDRLALNNERVTIIHQDARYYVKTRSDEFDLVIARLPEPTSALRARFYTDEFCRELRRSMKDQAVLCMTASATPTNLSRESATYLASMRATLQPHFPHVVVGCGSQALVLAATAEDLVTIDPVELERRYRQREVRSELPVLSDEEELRDPEQVSEVSDSADEWNASHNATVGRIRLYMPYWLRGTDELNAEKVRQRAAELDAAEDVQVSTDLRPWIYVQRLLMWERMMSVADDDRQRVLEPLCAVGWPKLIAILVAVAAITLVVYRFRGGPQTGWSRGTVVLSVATTGFATMALSIIWLFAFQNLYGYVYQRIGWIIALFMGGLVIGCAVINRGSRRVADRPEPFPGENARLPACSSNEMGSGLCNHRRSLLRLQRYLWYRFIAVDVLLAALALLVPVILPLFGAMQTTPLALVLVEVAISVMVALTGVLGGAAFALAGGLQLSMSGQPGAAAGSVVGADHAGACAGALLTGILLVPVFGTATAAFLLVGIKIVSAILLTAGWRLSGYK